MLVATLCARFAKPWATGARPLSFFLSQVGRGQAASVFEIRFTLLGDHEYTFSRGSGTAASVSKKWFSWSDTYGVDVDPGEDDLLILASTVVIDMACHGDRSR